MRRAWTCAEALRGGCRERLLDLFATVDRRLAREARHPRSSRSKRPFVLPANAPLLSGRAEVTGCRVLAESRQSCSRRTAFLRFAAKGVEPDLVALPVGLRFYVSRGDECRSAMSWPVARPSRRNSGTLSRDGDRAEELNGGRETRKKRLHKPFTLFHRCLYKQQRNPRHKFGEVWSNSS